MWDDDVDWNGVIFPVTLRTIKDFKGSNVAIRSPKTYQEVDAGEVSFDIQSSVRRSRKRMAETIAQIDRIRAVDVPWRMYLIMFIILMILLGLITGGLFQSLRLPTSFMILAMVSLVVLMIIIFLCITFFGFKQEEIQDAKRLAALYNEIKVERINQLNNVRAGLKLKNLNLGRPKKDVDIQFLRTYNKFRMQANVFASGPQNGQSIETFFEEIKVKLDEICFRNAYFLKRLHAQMPTGEEISQMNSNSQKLDLVRYVFSTCVLVNIFGQQLLSKQNNKKKPDYSRLCLDNIQECVNRADSICESEQVKQFIMQASGCSHSEVQLTIQVLQNDSVLKLKEKCDNLTKVFRGAMAKLPPRQYEKITRSVEDIEDTNIQEEFSFK